MNITESFFHKGICLFCGKEADTIYSGHRDVYLDCDCELRTEYNQTRKLLCKIAKIAEDRKEKLELEEKIENTKKLLVCYERNLSRMKI